MRILRSILLLTIVAASAQILSAQNISFESDLLSRLAAASRCKLDSLSAGGCFVVGSCQDKPVYVECDDNLVVTNVGLCLFDHSDLEGKDAVVMRFIERYLLEVLSYGGKSIQWKLDDDNVSFAEGFAYDVVNVRPDTPFSLVCKENKYYDACWTLDGGKTLRMSFPARMELILGMPKVEIERKLQSCLEAMPDTLTDTSFPSCTTEDSIIFYPVSVSSYMLPSVNDASYYNMDESGNLFPICDENNKILTLANIFQGVARTDYKLAVRQRLYGFESVRYSVGLNQWINYCRNNGITSYFAIESEDNDNYKVLLICESLDFGFNHLLSVLVPKDFLIDRNAEFNVILDAFIPTHNVKNLYDEKQQ